MKHPVGENTPLLGLVRDPKFLSLVSGVLASGEAVKCKLQFMSGAEANNDASVFEAYAGPLEATSFGGSPHRGALVILHDITGLERLERIRRDFVANVSHELRTPLTAIRGYAETLLGGALDDSENNRRFVEIIQAHAIRLNNIASDLLTLSDLESGRRDAEPGPISVEEAVNTALLTVEPEARIRGVHLVRGAVRDALITGHAIRLEQALVNLLDNAVKFNKPGGEARIDAGTTPDGRIYISVSDTGNGMPSEDLPRIFERFYRVDRARSREVGGTGLGLVDRKARRRTYGRYDQSGKPPGQGLYFYDRPAARRKPLFSHDKTNQAPRRQKSRESRAFRPRRIACRSGGVAS